MKRIVLPALLSSMLFSSFPAFSQQVLETGGQKMPDEWIDKDTKHHVVRLTRNGASNLSFYFHNNPFIGNKMVYYSSRANQAKTDQKLETSNPALSRNKQVYLLDLKSL